jgi:hypothetical protein
MPDFGETVGPFINNLIRSLQEQAERLPPLTNVAEGIREFDLSPDQITEFAEKCASGVTALGNVMADMWQGFQERAQRNDQMPDHIDIPDDLSDLD